MTDLALADRASRSASPRRASNRAAASFPSARILADRPGPPVDVFLIAQLGHGAGDSLFESATARQRGHSDFIDALDEPSARLGDIDLAIGDLTALYSFSVGPRGHPFHRHAGHRVFTAISGSGGTELRFADISLERIEADPHSFIRALHHIHVPPDCLFTVRFGGEIWHQFRSLDPRLRHPALFAVSCHTNELGGALTAPARAAVLAHQASIPALTETLPADAADLLGRSEAALLGVPTLTLSLDAPAGTVRAAMCRAVRDRLGRARGAWRRWRGVRGFLSERDGESVTALSAPPPGSLLLDQLAGRFHHQDMVCLKMAAPNAPARPASAWMADLLASFLAHPPVGVSWLMRLRNRLVKPLGLRVSPLGCPVSSLLSAEPRALFAGRFPVLAQETHADDTRCQVILGADDKHLRFRACVGVRIDDRGHIDFTLGTRVECLNGFGRIYMAAIDHAHRAYIAPTLLRTAVKWM